MHSSVVEGPNKWEALSPGWVKANWDAALNCKEGRMGGGVVILDCCGQVVVASRARCFSRGRNPSPIAAKSMAALVAIDRLMPGHGAHSCASGRGC
jgi:hypothetical protein